MPLLHPIKSEQATPRAPERAIPYITLKNGKCLYLSSDQLTTTEDRLGCRLFIEGKEIRFDWKKGQTLTTALRNAGVKFLQHPDFGSEMVEAEGLKKDETHGLHLEMDANGNFYILKLDCCDTLPNSVSNPERYRELLVNMQDVLQYVLPPQRIKLRVSQEGSSFTFFPQYVQPQLRFVPQIMDGVKTTLQRNFFIFKLAGEIQRYWLLHKQFSLKEPRQQQFPLEGHRRTAQSDPQAPAGAFSPSEPLQHAGQADFKLSPELPAPAIDAAVESPRANAPEEPSFPKPDRRPPSRFILETQVQLDGIQVQGREVPQEEPKILIPQSSQRSESQQEIPAQSEAKANGVAVLQMPQATSQMERYYPLEAGTKIAALPKENVQKARTSQAKTAKQHNKTKRSSVKTTRAASFVQLSKIKPLKAVIFDLDGVVINSMELHRKAFNSVLSNFGISISAAEFRQRYGATPAGEVMQAVFESHGIKEDVKEWTKKRNEHYLRYLYDTKLQPIAGFMDFYDMLVASGVKAAVASSGEEPHIRAALEAIGMRGMPIVSIQQVKRGKPAPDLFLLAAKRLKVKKGQAIVFEDAPKGLEAARRAGMPAIALSTTLGRRALKGKAAMIVGNFRSPALRKLFSSLLKGR